MAPIRPPRFDERAARARLTGPNALKSKPVYRAAPLASRAASKVLKPLARKFGPSLTEITERWPEIAGERLAANARPVKLTRGKTGGTLTLRTRGPAATLLQAEAPRIIERANLYCGPGTVARLAFQQGPLSFQPAPRKTAAPILKRGLTPSEEAELTASVEKAGSGRLRDGLARLGRAVLSRGVK